MNQVLEQGANTHKSFHKSAFLAALLGFLLTSVLTLPGIDKKDSIISIGFVLTIPIYIFSSIYSRLKQKKALSKSYVKIEAKDVLATNKVQNKRVRGGLQIISSVLLFVCLLFFYPTVFCYALYHYANVKTTWLEWFSLVCMVPWIMYLGVFAGGMN